MPYHFSTEPTLRYYATGRYRLAPRGATVVLQLEEATRPMQMPHSRWRDATPEDVFGLVQVEIPPTALQVGSAR